MSLTRGGRNTGLMQKVSKVKFSLSHPAGGEKPPSRTKQQQQKIILGCCINKLTGQGNEGG